MESSGGIGVRYLETKHGKNIVFRKDNKDWKMSDVQYFPPNPRLAYEDLPKAKAKDQVITSATNYVNKAHSGSSLQIFGTIGKAGMLVTMEQVASEGEEASGIKQSFLKITASKKDTGNNPVFWQTTDFVKSAGFTLSTSVAEKDATSLEPADLLETNQAYNIDQIISEVGSKLAGHTEMPALKKNGATLLRQIQTNTPKPLPGLNQYKTAIETKFGEIAAPIAMITGHLLSGDFKAAERSILKPQGYTFADVESISFPGKNEPLVDSYLHLPNGSKIGISSKNSAGGAAPSTAIIMQILSEHEADFAKDTKFMRKYATIMTNLKIVNDLSAIDGPLKLALKFKLITKDDAIYITSIFGKGIIKPGTLKRNAQHLFQILKSSSYTPDQTNLGYETGYHLLAVITRLVVDHLNKDAVLITEFFKAVINKSDICQVYAHTVSKGDALCFHDFNVVYPPTFEGTILVTAEKRYTSRGRPSGKISFEFNK